MNSHIESAKIELDNAFTRDDSLDILKELAQILVTAIEDFQGSDLAN